tara:strand:+ start:10946 stop:11314 length:369 start_codon:yes stop_codon:yes gene_type:complete
MNSEKTVTYDTSEMDRRTVLSYTFGNGDRALLVKLSGTEGTSEWQVLFHTLENCSGMVVLQTASLTCAVNAYGELMQETAKSGKHGDAFESWYLPLMDALLEDAFEFTQLGAFGTTTQVPSL